MRRFVLPALLACSAAPGWAAAASTALPPSRHGVDAPELARLGSYAVGFKTLRLVEHGQADPLVDRILDVDIWYPARTVPAAARMVYEASLPSEPPAAAARQRLWDQGWFEDPVWRKERVNAINVHFITAFLDLYLRDNESRMAYLDVAVTESDAGVWPNTVPPLAYDAYSPGTAGITVWKGFQRNHAAGLEFLQAPAQAPK